MAATHPAYNLMKMPGSSSVLTVSAMLKGEYGQTDVFSGVPCIINKNGVQRVLKLALSQEELGRLEQSCNVLRDSYEELAREGDREEV